MRNQAPDPYPRGMTALLAAVPDAEPLVAPWRARYDANAATGIPAHVTVLAPFLPHPRIDDTVTADLRTLIGAHRPFSVQFASTGRFDDLVYLAPVPDTPFRDLTAILTARWPETPPYGGRHGEPTPHLTVANNQTPDILTEVETALAAAEPVTAVIADVGLYVWNGRAWHRHDTYPLSG